MAIPLTSVPAPAALSDGDPELVALVREAEDSELEGGMVAVGGGTKGKRAEYRCTVCGYGIVIYGHAPSCPMCNEARWEHVEWRPFSQLLDFPLAPAASDVATRPPSPTAEESIRCLRPGQAGASLET